jgi:hypothetical protein
MLALAIMQRPMNTSSCPQVAACMLLLLTRCQDYLGRTRMCVHVPVLCCCCCCCAAAAARARMVVYDDFEVQFNASAKTKRGLQLPPYRYNVTARPRCARTHCHRPLSHKVYV